LLAEWNGAAAAKEKSDQGIESLVFARKQSQPARNNTPLDPNTATVDELLADGQLSTAIETLEEQVRRQPLNFDLLLKLAEAYGVYCRDAARAGKIIQRIEASAAFSAEQIQIAKAKLQEWKPAFS
jgi:hypothetical protein